MATKQRKAPTFKVICRAGTPNEMLDVATYSNPTAAKNFLHTRINNRREWASKFSLACDEKLGAIWTEISGLDLRGLHVGEERFWEATDDYSGVTFRFEVRLESR